MIAYPFLYLQTIAWLAVFNPHATVYVSSFFDSQAMKRVLPVALAGFRVGAIIASRPGGIPDWNPREATENP